MDDEILRKAADLGKAIAGSQEFKNLAESELALSEDENAMALIAEYESVRAKIEGTDGDSVTAEDFNKLESLRQKIQANTTIGKLIKSQTEYQSLIRGVNEAINSEIEKAMPKK